VQYKILKRKQNTKFLVLAPNRKLSIQIHIRLWKESGSQRPPEPWKQLMLNNYNSFHLIISWCMLTRVWSIRMHFVDSY